MHDEETFQEQAPQQDREGFTTGESAMSKPTEFVKRQRALNARARASRKGTLVWPASRGTYDPAQKLKAAWAAWDARRRERSESRDSA